MSQARTTLPAFCATAIPAAGALPRANDTGATPSQAISKVVIATISPLVGDTGVQTHTRSLHDGLIAGGNECVIQTPHTGHPWWLPIFGVRRIFGPLNQSWSTRWYRRWHAMALRNALLRLLRNRQTDAVLAQCPVSAAVALDVRSRLGMNFPISMACHFNYSEAKEYRDKGELADEASYQEILQFEHRVLGEVDSVVYVSGWAKRVVEHERTIKVRKSAVIWNGISAETGLDPATRLQLGLSADDLVLMNVGTLEKRKNQAGLIDLFAEISQEWPKAKLVLVGDGPQRGEVRRRIEERKLGDKVVMLGMRRDVPALLATADLYIHYSAMENCPVVLIEAARASLPIVAVPGGGVPELLAALGGFALDARSNTASIDTLRPLMGNLAARRQAGHLSRAAFVRSFTREAMVKEYLSAMQAAAGAPEVTP
ncbi:MAG TPA: glycosyltransferase family 4 protein [Tepidisphaeraceae bacterium]|jgi:glycosyltransferase involved in cell wall biosynthesis|nr:glycosyltransferase family 4 protein [Tepidisphaeraceae bacterium]